MHISPQSLVDMHANDWPAEPHGGGLPRSFFLHAPESGDGSPLSGLAPVRYDMAELSLLGADTGGDARVVGGHVDAGRTRPPWMVPSPPLSPGIQTAGASPTQLRRPPLVPSRLSAAAAGGHLPEHPELALQGSPAGGAPGGATMPGEGLPADQRQRVSTVNLPGGGSSPGQAEGSTEREEKFRGQVLPSLPRLVAQKHGLTPGAWLHYQQPSSEAAVGGYKPGPLHVTPNGGVGTRIGWGASSPGVQSPTGRLSPPPTEVRARSV